MKIMQITDDNKDDFISILGKDVAEDLSRIFFRGLGAKDDNDEAVGVFVYEIVESETDKDTRSIIWMLKSDNEKTAASLQSVYKNDEVAADGIAESCYELPGEKEASELEKAGFSKEKKESEYLRVTLSEFSSTAFAKKRKIPDFIRPLSDISVLEYRSAVKAFLARGQKGIADDLPYLPKKWFDGDVSICSTADGKIDGMFLVRATPSGILMPILYYAYGPDYVKNLAFMLCRSIENALEKYPPETQVVICRAKKASRDMMEKILPQAKGEEVFCGSRRE